MTSQSRLSRIPCWNLSLLVLAASCTAATDPAASTDADRTEPYSDETPTTLEPTVQAPGFVDPAELITSMPWIDPDELLGTEKIRKGTVANATHKTANSVVGITPLNGTCTAQVINRFFLLTAAHCAAAMWPSGSGQIGVAYTNQQGTMVPAYVGPVQTFVEPSPGVGRDTAVAFLVNGMPTCDSDILRCSIDIPNNAMFQFFVPGTPLAHVSNYRIAGYGESDDDLADNVLRTGTETFLSNGFLDNSNTAFATTLQYTADSQARPCHGDSGGPMMILGFSRYLHSGILQGAVGADVGCHPSSGTNVYAGLSVNQAAFVLNTLAAKAKALGFNCAASGNGTSGLYVFHCANDNTLYGPAK